MLRAVGPVAAGRRAIQARRSARGVKGIWVSHGRPVKAEGLVPGAVIILIG